MIDINNESGVKADELGLVALARFALSRLRIHPQADLSILLVDEATMAEYHQRFMDLPGPTDVMSFPMDELREPSDDEDPPLGLLGDIVLCPQVTARQAAENGREPDAEAEYLLIHGLLHLGGGAQQPPQRPCSRSVKSPIGRFLGDITGWDEARRRALRSGDAPAPGRCELVGSRWRNLLNWEPGYFLFKVG